MIDVTDNMKIDLQNIVEACEGLEKIYVIGTFGDKSIDSFIYVYLEADYEHLMGEYQHRIMNIILDKYDAWEDSSITIMVFPNGFDFGSNRLEEEAILVYENGEWFI